MTRFLGRYGYLIPILIGVVFLLVRVEEPSEPPTEETINMHETRSDYYLSDFVTRKFDEHGQLEYLISGSALAHYPIGNHSEITLPRVRFLGDGVTWDVRSDAGRFDAGPEVFQLSGDVTLERSNEQGEPVLIRTDRLTIATEMNLVSTDEAIEVAADTWTLQAVGFKSAIDDGKLKLLSSVKGRYDPPDAENR